MLSTPTIQVMPVVIAKRSCVLPKIASISHPCLLW
jgi:hypothetical protein